MKTIIATALLSTALGLAVPAHASTPTPVENNIHFAHDGHRYSARKIVADDGSYRLIGRDAVTGKHYSLRVAGKRVSGTFGGDDISFTVKAHSTSREVALR